MTKKENIELYKTYLVTLQRFAKVFWDLSDQDFTPILEPTKHSIENELIEKAENLFNWSKYETAIRSNRLIRYAEQLKNPDVRSKRVDTLLNRRKKVEEYREAKMERIARIADKFGFDGSLFRNSIPGDDDIISVNACRRLEEKINTIPKIIVANEEHTEPVTIPHDAELLSVAQVALMLGWGVSVVRQRDREGLIPMPIRNGGTIQWNRQELKKWINANCPARQKWEQMK